MVAPRSRAEMVKLHAVWMQAARVGATAGRAGAAEAEEAAEEAAEAAEEEEELLLGGSASEPMQPTPLLLSAEEGGRVSLTLVS